MSKKIVHQIIGRAVLDKEYLAKLIKTPAKVLSPYKSKLTKTEVAVLSTMTLAQTSKMQGALTKRITKGHSGGLT